VAGSRAAAIEEDGTTAVLWYAVDLIVAGYADEAAPLLEAAARRDPMVMPNQGWLAAAYLALDDIPRAEERTRRAAAVAPTDTTRWFWAIWLNGIAIELANRGDTARAAALFRETDPPATALSAAARAGLAGFYAALADPSLRLDFLAADGPAAALPFRGNIRWDLLTLGDADAFFADVDRIAAGRSLRFAFSWLRLGWAPSMTWLREDPRFLARARAAGLEDLWKVRGYPLGCFVVSDPGGDRLSCPPVKQRGA
jgi:hypothetical protein